jgi:predicted DNA-binding transcriptional regulator AlpA
MTMAASRTRDSQDRPFPPDYVSAQTLAHRLDCSTTTVREYVRRGLLPRPVNLGDLVRWRWADVESFIRSLEAGAEAGNNDDPYLASLVDVDGTSEKTGD